MRQPWVTCTFVLLLCAAMAAFSQQPRRIYIANDDHTDYWWTAGEDTYRAAFLTMLDSYLDQADQTQNNLPDFQGRFNADGSYWLWTYEKNRTVAQFQRLIDRIRDGHITVPLQTLVLCYGAMPAEAVIRSMYYPGRIERAHNLRFELVSAMENQTLPYGLSSLWAGAGARFSWKGVCGCATRVGGLADRGREIYYAVGPDGRSVLMKWHSLAQATSSGGYAEARSPGSAVEFATSDPDFLSRYPFPEVVGMFGKGYDDLQTLTNEFITIAQVKSNASRRVIVSNEVDFFRDFVQSAPDAQVPRYSASFGNEWELYATSLAEVTATVKRSVETLRTAEGLASLVSLADPLFMSGKAQSADSAFNTMGLYYEHDWTADGPASGGRLAFQRRSAAQVHRYVTTLLSDAGTKLSTLIRNSSGAKRFYVFNPLGWQRSDVADIPYGGPLPVRVFDLASSKYVRSQLQMKNGQPYLRVLADSVPSIGYKVYELQDGAATFTDSAATFEGGNSVIENDLYRLTVNGRGAITSLQETGNGNIEWAATIDGRQLNDIGFGSGSFSPENVGPVSADLVVGSGNAYRTRITLYKTLDRIDIENEIATGVGDDPTTYGFAFNISNYTVRHEEIGAIATAKPQNQGGNYADEQARLDYLTMNHFVDLSNGQRGVTLSNRDCSFFALGHSSGNDLDVSTPLVRALAAGRIDAPMGFANQGGDTFFLNRFALCPHGAYDQGEAMRTALEHQNPFYCGFIGRNAGFYPGSSYSLLAVADSTNIVWAVKPSEEGIDEGLIVRIWNMGQEEKPLILSLRGASASAAWTTTHIETNTGAASLSASTLSGHLSGQMMQTYRLRVSKPAGPELVFFNAVPDGENRARLEWTTYSESDLQEFQVYRKGNSDADFVWLPGSMIQGSGDIGITRDYSYVDSSASVGAWTYRLKLLYADGSAVFSSPVDVELVTGVPGQTMPARFELLQNFPNPFNPSSSIRFSLPVRGYSKLMLFNVLGEVVAILQDGMLDAGMHEIRIEAARLNLSSGVYYYRLQAGALSQARCMTYLK